MFLSTTNILEGKEISSYEGVISSEVIIGANIIKDIFASFTDFFGGRSSKYERSLVNGKNEALDELISKAKERGADGIIGIDFDYEAIGKGTMFMINVSGTAVKFK